MNPPAHHNKPEACLAALLSTFTTNPTHITLNYLAEGNANVIYTLSSTPTPSDTETANNAIETHTSCAVLRLRKKLPFTYPSATVLSAFHTHILPLFDGEYRHLLMHQVLLPLDQGIVDGLNDMLHSMETEPTTASNEKVRAVARRGAYHPDFSEEPNALLMPNLHVLGGRVREFKPKWLVQSPSAPENAKRCRTCAVNLLRRVKGKHRGRGDAGFCPFALLSTAQSVLGNVLEILDGEGGKELTREFVRKVLPALVYLRELQGKFMGVGLNEFRSPEGREFGVAMALRDCSVFLVINNGEILDVKFADLDLKTTEGGKVERWAEIEDELIEKGMYTDDVEADETHPCFWTRHGQ